jgi:hypothetical protein
VTETDTKPGHHARVRKVDGEWPWLMECLCGAVIRGIEWQVVVDWGVAHVRINEFEMEPVDLLPLIKTKLAWDLLEHDQMHVWLPRLGLVPAAEDMVPLEHKEAHARAAKVVPLASIAETYAAIIADIQTVYFAHESGTQGMDHSEFTDTIFRLVRAGLFSILAEFLADGVIAYGPAVPRQQVQQ